METLWRIGAWLLILALTWGIICLLVRVGRSTYQGDPGFPNGSNMDSDEVLGYDPGDLDDND